MRAKSQTARSLRRAAAQGDRGPSGFLAADDDRGVGGNLMAAICELVVGGALFADVVGEEDRRRLIGGLARNVGVLALRVRSRRRQKRKRSESVRLIIGA